MDRNLSFRRAFRYAILFGIGCCWLVCSLSAIAAPSVLSQHLEVVEQSLEGVTFHLSLPSHKGEPHQSEPGLIAIPPGGLPEVQIQNVKFRVWSVDGKELSTHTIDAEKKGDQLEQWLTVSRLVSVRDLGLMRQQRLASVLVFPYPVSKKNGGTRLQVYDLTFRLVFSGATGKAPAEPSFDRGFPSGFEGIFNKLVANAETAPAGTIVADDSAPVSELPYHSQPSLRLICDQAGYYFLPAGELSALSKKALLPSELALYLHRQEVPLAVIRRKGSDWWIDSEPERALSDNDGVLFYAPLSESPYTAETVLFLTTSGGTKRFVSAPRQATDTADRDSVTTTTQTFVAEENRQLWKKRNFQKDTSQHLFWIWQEVSGEESFEERIDLPGPLVETEAASTVRMRMVVLSQRRPGSFNLDGYLFKINGQPITQKPVRTVRRIEEARYTVLEYPLPVSLFDPAQPVLRIEIEADPAANRRGMQPFAIDCFEFDYERGLQVTQDGLKFSPRQNETGWVLELSREARGEKLLPLAMTGQNQFLELSQNKTRSQLTLAALPLSGTDSIQEIQVLTETALTRMPRVERSYPNRLHQPGPRADLIVITHPMFLQQIDPLLQLRRKQGYAVRVATTTDIYRDFGDGRLNPQDIKEFLRYAYHTWGPPRPSYVLLVGDARWDYWGNYDLGIPNLLPSYHVDPAYCSDNWYACVEGDDVLPDYLISRLSVADTTAARSAVEKMVEYETEPAVGPWRSRVLFVSDNDEEVFEEESERQMQQRIPPYMQVKHLRLRDFPLKDDFGAPEASRVAKKLKHSEACLEAMLATLEQGTLLWEYYGHGSPNVFAGERIFFGGDTPFSHVKRLKNRPYLPMLVALTCDTIQFDYAGELGPKWALCIGEELLTHPTGGAIAVYGASGRGYTNHHVKLNNGFHDALFDYGFRTTGDLVTISKLLAYAIEQSDEPVNMFGLLGDGLTTLALPPANIPVQIKKADVVEGQGGSLTVSIDLSALSSRQLKKMQGLLSVEDAKTQSIASRSIEELSDEVIDQEVAIPSTAAAGKGRASFVLSPQNEKERGGEMMLGGAAFRIKREPHPDHYPLGAKPDLYLDSEAIKLSPDYPLTGETVFIDLNIANRGQAPASNVTAMAYNGDPEKGGTMLPDLSNYSPPRLSWIGPGETRRLRLRWDPFKDAGWQTLYVRVDPEKQVEESNENNNSATATIYIRKKMDLALFEEDFSIKDLGRRKGYELSAAVRNRGEVESVPCKILVRLYDSADADNPALTQVIDLPKRIAPYRYNPETDSWGGGRARFHIPLPATTQRIEIIVDPEEMLYEETHTNNSFAATVEDLKKNAE